MDHLIALDNEKDLVCCDPLYSKDLAKTAPILDSEETVF